MSNVQKCTNEVSHHRSLSDLWEIIRYSFRVCVCVCVCVCRNDVPRVAQRYGTISAHTRRRASVLVVFCVVHMYSFAGLIRRTPPLTFGDTAITDRHSDTTIFQLRAYWVRISWSIGSEKSFGHVPPVGVEPYPLGQALRYDIHFMLLRFTY